MGFSTTCYSGLQNKKIPFLKNSPLWLQNHTHWFSNGRLAITEDICSGWKVNVIRIDALCCVSTETLTAASSPCSFYQAGPAVSQQCLRKPWNCSTSIKNAISPVQRTELHSEIKRTALKYGEGISKRNEGAFFCILFWFLYFFFQSYCQRRRGQEINL